MGDIVVKTMAEIIAEGSDPSHVDRARLAATTDEDIIRQMIEDGEDPHENLGDWYPSPLKVRQGLGLTQEQMAELLEMPLAAWLDWEQVRVAINAPGRALLTILQKEPEAAMRAMRAKEAA